MTVLFVGVVGCRSSCQPNHTELPFIVTIIKQLPVNGTDWWHSGSPDYYLLLILFGLWNFFLLIAKCVYIGRHNRYTQTHTPWWAKRYFYLLFSCSSTALTYTEPTSASSSTRTWYYYGVPVSFFNIFTQHYLPCPNAEFRLARKLHYKR